MPLASSFPLPITDRFRPGLGGVENNQLAGRVQLGPAQYLDQRVTVNVAYIGRVQRHIGVPVDDL